MSDRFPGRIRIGGTVPASVLPELIEVFAQEGVSHEYGAEGSLKPDDDPKELDGYIDEETGYLTFYDDQARNGEFERIENFCQENGIDFDRHSDHYCEYDAEWVMWRKGMKNPIILFSDARGDEIIAADPVRKAIKLIQEWQDYQPHSANSEKHRLISQAKQLLNDACRPIAPTLTQFEISY